MKITRRNLLTILALLALADYGRGLIAASAGQPPGWKTERWQAGFGSWANGGYGVAWDISMPKSYHFDQKCGIAWISDDEDGPEFAVRWSFLPDANGRNRDFQQYLREDAIRFREPQPPFPKIGAQRDYRIGAHRFSRLDFTMRGAGDAPAGTAPSGEAKGFWLQGENLSVVADLREGEQADIDEHIVASMRRADGYDIFDLLGRTIPGLLGC